MENILNQIRNLELEQTIIGSIMSNDTLWLELIENDIDETYFYDNKLREILKIMQRLSKDNETIDLHTVGNEIVKKKINDKVSITYLSELVGAVPSTVAFKTYLKELKKYKEKRDIKELMQYIQTNFEEDNKKLKDGIMRRILELTTSSKKDTGDIKDGIQKLKDDLEFRLTNKDKNKIGGMVTGLIALDLTLDGFNKGEFITVVARSGIGKTTFATSVILNMIRNEYRISMISMEMPQEQILKKMAFNYCNIDQVRYTKGELNKEEVSQIIRFTDWIEEKNNINIFSESNFNKIVSKIKAQHLKAGLDIVFIDYLNKITGIKGNTRDIELNTITSTLKDIALQENICIVALTQANRQVDKQQDKRLTLADIKESSSIEQNSDKIIALYRNKNLDNPVYREELFKNNKLDYNKRNADFNPSCMELEILKNRHGECKTIACRWDGKISRVRNW